MKERLCALGIILVLPAVACASQGCPQDAELTVRNGHAMAYDARQGVVVLFGGADEHRVLSDLWAWNGREWRCLATDGPRPRTFAALAWDGVSERLILFGGNGVLFGAPDAGHDLLDDTWAWDGRRWRQAAESGPPARAEASAAWDPRRRRLVLFGGYGAEQERRVRFGDTWDWDGDRWHRLDAAGPSPRNGSALADDPLREVLVLFGGNGPAADTWEWDGARWVSVPVPDTEGRFNPAMAYDPAARAVLRFGGWTGATRTADTWRFDGRSWIRIDRDGPSARNHTAMVLDARRGVVMLHGGHDGERVFGDTWEWRAGTWSKVAEHAPRQRVDNGH